MKIVISIYNEDEQLHDRVWLNADDEGDISLLVQDIGTYLYEKSYEIKEGF